MTNSLYLVLLVVLVTVSQTLPVSAAMESQNGAQDELSKVRNLVNRGAYSKAKPLVEKVILDNPSYLDAHLTAARLYKLMGLWSRATVEYEWVRQRDPSKAEPYIALSEMYLVNLSSGLALSMAEEAVRIDPSSRQANAQLISALLANYKYQEADQRMRQLSKKYPRDGEIKYLAYKLSKETGDLKMAKRNLKEAIKLKPGKIAWLLELCDVCESLRDINCAKSAIKNYLEVSPDSIEALQKLAWLEERYLYDYRAATDSYNKILDLDPENWVAEAGLDRLQAKRKDAAEVMKRSLKKFFSGIGSWLSSFSAES